MQQLHEDDVRRLMSTSLPITASAGRSGGILARWVVMAGIVTLVACGLNGMGERSFRHEGLMGWTPPDGIGVPGWRC